MAQFFSASFGESYLGDERFYKKLSEVTSAFALQDEHEGIAAAALIAGRRITMPGTSPDRESFGDRTANMARLLQSCCQEGYADWISIGPQYSKMQHAAYLAGLERSAESELIAGLLAEAGDQDKYGIGLDEHGEFLITNYNSKDRPSYQQQVWIRTF